MKEVLIVDGYNIIGAWRILNDLKKESLELSRDRLVGILEEYQKVTGMEVIVVFDAHMSPGPRKECRSGRVQVLFSKEEETADEMIERIVYEMEKQVSHIYVATSDLVEQQVTFGEGALRISARELEARVNEARKTIQLEMKKLERQRNTLGDHLDEKVAEIFEKWRRKDID
jgi:predicted RNA-binding protein with PIN domain